MNLNYIFFDSLQWVAVRFVCMPSSYECAFAIAIKFFKLYPKASNSDSFLHIIFEYLFSIFECVVYIVSKVYIIANFSKRHPIPMVYTNNGFNTFQPSL